MKMISKSTLSMLLFLFSILSFNSCSDNKDDDELNIKSNSISGVFYYYEDEESGVIRVLDAYGEFRRRYTLSEDVTLQSIVNDRRELFLKAYRPSVLSPAYPNGRFIKPVEEREGWLLSSNVIIDLIVGDDDDWFEVSGDDDLAYGFIFHKVDEIDGEEVYAIESMRFPGKYISHQGHPIQGTNTLFLTAHDEPEKAFRYRIFKAKGTFLEADPNVPTDAEFAVE